MVGPVLVQVRCIGGVVVAVIVDRQKGLALIVVRFGGRSGDIGT